eukprot:CAMPEP_0172926214 /NCGR_PEP_ID=MMETSP1075-20121228/215202_1 /TAXON_ID=2916 /ORGANISM="Ceratium fusus, Strain PA161109" /LENGTH=60 /DNA_ID=CAMNT_0013787243 /DNA_START=563 /DNA_END=745 /DNA_ORIENTATION=-
MTTRGVPPEPSSGRRAIVSFFVPSAVFAVMATTLLTSGEQSGKAVHMIRWRSDSKALWDT